MNSGPALVQTLFLAAFGFFGYGPVQDHSEFISTRLADDGRTVVFTLHQFAYQSATGWRAFPDGGVPRYVKDVNLAGTYDLQTHRVRTLRRQKNSQWQPGDGLFTIHAINGTKALLVQGGQLRGTFKLDTKYVLVDIQSGKCAELDLRSDLGKHGREPGEIYLVDSTGTLVFVTRALQQPKIGSAVDRSVEVPEIWVRMPGGAYLKAANSAHYERTLNGEVIYWEPSTRLFMAFSIATGRTHPLPGYKVPGYQDITHGVILSPDHRGLQVGQKVSGNWIYRPLELKLDAIK
ncbi:MAG TPA: hypothetical protein VL793_11820 [Patescibacteria group bacterium]|nr:hypothetical protein [Patescibacteria group bacterium]